MLLFSTGDNMLDKIDAVIWDFDGVLNRNIVGGRFVWADDIEADCGIDLADFQDGIFTAAFADVIRGKIDLLVHVQQWLDQYAAELKAEQLLDYWFRKDDLKDTQTNLVLDWLNERGVQQFIATNNEDRRVRYIEEVSGFKHKVSRVFSSGRMGIAKPDPRYFDHISDTLGLSPAKLLLIDDSASNIRAAEALGWKTFHFTESTRAGLATYLTL